MQIEAGKTYRARNGSKFGPMQPARSEGYDFYGSDGGIDRVFQKNGKHGSPYIKPDSNLDLIAEWTEGPVRTVTRREVVPGFYHGIYVGEANHMTGSVQLRINEAYYGADTLKAAAAVLLELAGALDE